MAHGFTAYGNISCHYTAVFPEQKNNIECDKIRLFDVNEQQYRYHAIFCIVI